LSDSYSRLAAALWFLPIDQVEILASFAEEASVKELAQLLDTEMPP
jgi:hypothetical protein